MRHTCVGGTRNIKSPSHSFNAAWVMGLDKKPSSESIPILLCRRRDFQFVKNPAAPVRSGWLNGPNRERREFRAVP